MTQWAVVLAGGVGSRFWPLSTPARPKQLLPLVGSRPLLRETLDRLAPLADAEHTLVLTNAALVPAVAAVASELPRENVVAEPRPAGTAAALTWAALEIQRRAGPEAVMACVHADWAIGDDAGFRAALARAAALARTTNLLVTVGVAPSRPETGFGYIQPGAPLGVGAWRVARFVEKPDRDAAVRMLADGYLWNSGIFVWLVGSFLDEVRAHTPEIRGAVERADEGIEAFFAAARSVPVDVGVLERSRNVAVVPGDFAWDDVGTWDALHRVRPTDAAGNATHGPVSAVDATGNVVHADDTTVVLFGVSDLVVVARAGLTLVTTRDRAADLKSLLDALPANLRAST